MNHVPFSVPNFRLLYCSAFCIDLVYKRNVILSMHRRSRSISYELHGRKYSKPASIMLLRHGESEANVNHDLYGTKGDPNICLTEKGEFALFKVCLFPLYIDIHIPSYNT